MMVVYQCYGRSHTSIVAAHIHLGHLRMNETPGIDQLIALPFFDAAHPDDMGRPLLLGCDAGGHEVFALGLGTSVRAGLGAFCSVYRLFGEDEPLVVDTLRDLGIIGRVGGGLSRQLGWVSLGRPMVAYDVRRIYPRLVSTVASVKRLLGEMAHE